MFKTIFLKTLYERRWSTVIWTLSMVVMTFLIILLFPSLRDSLGTALQNVPDSMKDLLGSAEDYQTITGYVDLQIVAQMIFLTIIMSIITGTSLLAGEEKAGTLQTLLAQPITRRRAYVEKFAALAIMTWWVAFVGLFAGVVAGVLVLGETINIARLLMACGMTWLITLFFGVAAFSIGGIGGKRGTAGVVTGGYAFVAYMLTALAGAAPALEKLNYGSIFHYFNDPSILWYGLSLKNIMVLLVATGVLFIVGLILFRKRDISSR